MFADLYAILCTYKEKGKERENNGVEANLKKKNGKAYVYLVHIQYLDI